jgi:hypothetical protein
MNGDVFETRGATNEAMRNERRHHEQVTRSEAPAVVSQLDLAVSAQDEQELVIQNDTASNFEGAAQTMGEVDDGTNSFESEKHGPQAVSVHDRRPDDLEGARARISR